MAIEFMACADLQDINVWSAIAAPVSGTVAISNEQARTGGYSFKVFSNYSGTYMQKTLTARGDYYFKACFFIHSSTKSQDYANYIQSIETSTIHVTIIISPYGGNLRVYRGTTSYLAAATNLPLKWSTWHCLEGYVKVHDTAGEVTLKLDGIQVLNATSIDTRNGATGIINLFKILHNSDGTYAYYDDIVVRDDAWPGLGGIELLTPTSDGTDDGVWTASTGDAYSCVDDNPPNDFTDYISTDVSVLNRKQTYNLSDLSAGTFTTIAIVGVYSKAKLDGAGAGNIRNIILSSGNYGNGSSVAQSTTADYTAGFFIVDPNTSAAWTAAGVNALEAGVETI